MNAEKLTETGIAFHSCLVTEIKVSKQEEGDEEYEIYLFDPVLA